MIRGLALVVLFGVAYAVPGSSHLVWNDCSQCPCSSALRVHHFDIRPHPIKLPGEIFISLNLTVHKEIPKLFIDTEVYKDGVLGEAKIPCIWDIGSCENIDACFLLNRNPSSSTGIGMQPADILMAALGYRMSCPIHRVEVNLYNERVTLKEVPAVLDSVVTGDFRTKFIFKDDPSSMDNIGCLEFRTSVSFNDGGLLFG